MILRGRLAALAAIRAVAAATKKAKTGTDCCENLYPKHSMRIFTQLERKKSNWEGEKTLQRFTLRTTTPSFLVSCRFLQRES
jgi:hypothetical protein